MRGLQSKIDTVANILVEKRIDVAFLCETHNQGTKNIKIPDSSEGLIPRVFIFYMGIDPYVLFF